MLDLNLKLDSKSYAKRRLLVEIPQLTSLLINRNLKRIIKTIDDNAFLVKAIYFNKPLQANWYVTWHQDVPINLQDKLETEGFTSWTSKDGVIGACPPLEVSKNCFTIRIHLDDTNEQNGGLKVLPGSHQKRLSNEEIGLITANSVHVNTEVHAGDVHLMKPPSASCFIED